MRCFVRVLFFLWVIQGFAAFNLTWGTPAVSLDSNPPLGDTDGNAVIALDPMGNGVAVWGRTTGQKATEDVWADSYNHSLRTWSGPVKISGGGNAVNGRVAMDPNGNAHFVWEEGFPTQIMYRTLSAEGVWTPNLASPPEQIFESALPQFSPQIKVDGEGNALAVWMELKRGLHKIHSAQKRFDGSWASLGIVSPSRGNSLLSSTKTISMNDSGKALLVWEEAVNGRSQIWGARYKEYAWEPPFLISDETEKKCDSPAVGIDDQGNSVIVWHEDGSIQSKALIHEALSPQMRVSDPAYKAIHPDIAVDGMGNGVVVYERYNPLHKFITGALLPFGTPAWEAPTDISAPSPAEVEAAGYPVLTINKIGDGVVIWKEFTGTHLVIQGAGYSLGSWSSIRTLSSVNHHSGSPTPAYDISVGVNVAGNIIAVWPEDSSQTGSFQLKANTGSQVQLKATVGTGLANFAPLPPLPEPKTILSGIASGYQVKHKFPAHTDLINILSWTGSNGAHEYRIYRENLSTLIGTSSNTRFEDHQRSPKKQEIYLITAVDMHGQESTPMTIVVDAR